MDDDQDQIHREMEHRSTDELISILRNRDEEEWRPEVFEIVTSILRSRGVSSEQVSALGPEGVDVLESQPLVTVARFFSPAEAHTARMALEDAGVEAWVADESVGTMYGVGVGARVQVRESDAETAKTVLAQEPVPGDALPADLAEPACPVCGSRHVAPEAWIFDPSTEERQLPTPAESGPSRRKWYYVCADCGEAWPA